MGGRAVGGAADLTSRVGSEGRHQQTRCRQQHQQLPERCHRRRRDTPRPHPQPHPQPARKLPSRLNSHRGSVPRRNAQRPHERHPRTLTTATASHIIISVSSRRNASVIDRTRIRMHMFIHAIRRMRCRRSCGCLNYSRTHAYTYADAETRSSATSATPHTSSVAVPSSSAADSGADSNTEVAEAWGSSATSVPGYAVGATASAPFPASS